MIQLDAVNTKLALDLVADWQRDTFKAEATPDQGINITTEWTCRDDNYMLRHHSLPQPTNEATCFYSPFMPFQLQPDGSDTAPLDGGMYAQARADTIASDTSRRGEVVRLSLMAMPRRYKKMMKCSSKLDEKGFKKVWERAIFDGNLVSYSLCIDGEQVSHRTYALKQPKAVPSTSSVYAPPPFQLARNPSTDPHVWYHLWVYESPGLWHRALAVPATSPNDGVQEDTQGMVMLQQIYRDICSLAKGESVKYLALYVDQLY